MSVLWYLFRNFVLELKKLYFPIISFFLSFSLPDMLCDPTDFIWRKGTPFEAMTGRTAPSSDGLLAEVFQGFPQLYGKFQEICAQSP